MQSHGLEAHLIAGYTLVHLYQPITADTVTIFWYGAHDAVVDRWPLTSMIARKAGEPSGVTCLLTLSCFETGTPMETIVSKFSG